MLDLLEPQKHLCWRSLDAYRTVAPDNIYNDFNLHVSFDF